VTWARLPKRASASSKYKIAIDVGAVIKKYVGETEIRLHRLFDNAEGASGGLVISNQRSRNMLPQLGDIRRDPSRFIALERGIKHER
jgi:hypothetical protein